MLCAKIRFALISILACTVWTRPAQAEYRLFQLAIVNLQSGQTRTVVSILDNIQYRTYYPLTRSEQVQILDTWMCWGRQGEGVRPCPNPRAANTGTPPSASLPKSTQPGPSQP